ncbi:formate dehydrogenase accessory sulfurtransferase FdhD [Octadecabacter sp. 1_MG-2023]|uniref:formate dehydrogenase accessory sulfurtransferase FdhD n=1 Tax=unclassified Octadecabacter TaxID=196158 RepID=UPI001C08A491|nr:MULTISPECIES: formate dehydrogenase accessory sulfurtransferase FdhD [unclassified Octadecabacter]MBU2993063.1 formate dehydrogenase accessory sulfurtransferase FdhD [Octadecabacter sp. B2R22]MDO6733485.1 formate dehydrogenase accessory sulfurtransferase FdhD [Octadecabacter sp. 1_MG-2023]
MTQRRSSKGARATDALVVRGGLAEPATRNLPEEVPVALVYNGTTQAVMMATPCDLEDFGRGFTRTEGWGEVDSVEVVSHPNGIEVQMWLPEDQAETLATRRRAMAGPVGCGLCGIDSLDQAARAVPPVTADVPFTPQDIATAMKALRGGQDLHDTTRAVHGAGFYTSGQGLSLIREDVGRHNALDKLIGATVDCSAGAVVLTSRVSVEMVQKTAMAGCAVIFAVSAPTTLAVETAQAANITLVALARDDGFEIFTHSHRIQTKDASHVA